MSATSDITSSRPKTSKTKNSGFDFSPWKTLPPPVLPGGSSHKHTPGILERIVPVILILLLSPLLLAIALTLKISAPRDPVFYKQERVGIDRRKRNTNGDNTPMVGDRRKTPGEGKPFMIWKFRTMRPDAEKDTGPVWAAEGDPRVTKLGRIMRDVRLDELPQLFNVVCGNMRMIGPRPERPHFVRSLTTAMPDYTRRLAVPPGITGLAQVERKYDADLNDVKTKLGYDLFYVENRCKLLDLKILLKTVTVVVRGFGAR